MALRNADNANAWCSALLCWLLVVDATVEAQPSLKVDYGDEPWVSNLRGGNLREGLASKTRSLSPMDRAASRTVKAKTGMSRVSSFFSVTGDDGTGGPSGTGCRGEWPMP